MPLNDILSRDKVLRKPEYYHAILVKGLDLSDAKKKVLDFFERYQLVRYSHIELLEKDSFDAGRSGFEDALNTAIKKNRKIVRTLVQELQDEGITAVEQLGGISQGYQSKMLHVLTHFLDGFFADGGGHVEDRVPHGLLGGRPLAAATAHGGGGRPAWPAAPGPPPGAPGSANFSSFFSGF
mgnify:CR=1 FL=1